MKIRNGFVSNSSTSSFICNFCGEIFAERDSNLSDFDLVQCEHGHVFCEDHSLKPIEIESVDVFKALKNLIVKWGDEDQQIIQEVLDICIKENDCTEERFTKEFEDRDEDLADEYDLETLIEDYEFYNNIPEVYCPVCQRAEKMKEDSEWLEYERLYKKFDKLTPYGCRLGEN